MKRRRTKCAACGNTGGRFTLRGRRWYHTPKCDKNFIGTVDTARDPFQFETENLLGPASGPIKVQGLAHLRRLEKEYGVISMVANYDQNNQYVRGGKDQYHDDGRR